MEVQVRLRRHMVKLYEEGKRVKEISEGIGYCRKTVYKWLRRYREEGEEGLKDRSRRPRGVKRIEGWKEQEVLKLRQEVWGSPLKLSMLLKRRGIRISSGAIYNCLKRHGLNRREKEKEPVERYERSRSGELVHVDVKLIGVMAGYGKQYEFTAVDDATRRALALRYPDKSARSAVDFLSKVYGWSQGQLEALLCDNGKEFTHHTRKGKWGHRFQRKARELEVKVKHTKVRRPQTNGKVERFHRTIQEEFYSQHFFSTPEELDLALARYLVYYNGERPHLGIKGLTPQEKYAILSLDRKGVVSMRECA